MTKRFQVEIKVIPHSSHRYSTCGDYWVEKNGKRVIHVSDMGNADYELLVSIHELIEQHLCLKRGIREEDITAFDKAHIESLEPGMEKDAPYHKEHVFATEIEKAVCAELGIEWEVYDKAIEALP